MIPQQSIRQRRLLWAALLLSCHYYVSTNPVVAFGALFGRSAETAEIAAKAVNEDGSINPNIWLEEEYDEDEARQSLVEITRSSSMLGIQHATSNFQKQSYIATLHLQLQYAVPEINDTSPTYTTTMSSSGATVTTVTAYDNNNNPKKKIPNLQDLAWIVPLPVAPSRVYLGSALLFYALRNQTKPSFDLDIFNATQAMDVLHNGDDSHLAVRKDNMDDDDDATGKGKDSYTNWTYCTPEMVRQKCRNNNIKRTDVFSVGNFTTLGKEPVKNNNSDNNKGEDEEAFVMPVSTNVAGYFDYVVLDNAKDVLLWLQTLGYLSIHTEDEDYNLWLELLQDYSKYNPQNVFMGIQLDHAPNATFGTSQPIMIEYDLVPSTKSQPLPTTTSKKIFNLVLNSGDLPFLHRLPYQLSAMTAAPNATFDAHVLSDDNDSSFEKGSRAVPINYLDVEMDDAFVDWMGCYQNITTTDDSNGRNPVSMAREMAHCFQQDYENRWYTVTKTIFPQSLVTEYVGSVDAIYEPLSVPEGLTLILAASSSWLNFLNKLKASGVPPVPLVLEIMDRYVPPSSFDIQNGEEETAAACRSLDHLYDAPMKADGNMPALRDCYDLYTPPSPEWTFDARSLASELENRIFQPSRRADDWMRQLSSLTRLWGRIDSASQASMHPNSTTADPHIVLSSFGNTNNQNNWAAKRRVSAVHSAIAAPICNGQSGTPYAWEMTLSPSTKLSNVDENDNAESVWQLGTYDCPSESWQPTDEGPIIVTGNPEQDPVPTNRTLVSSLYAWGLHDGDGVELLRNLSSGGFAQEDLDEAVIFANALLDDLLELQFTGTYGSMGNDPGRDAVAQVGGTPEGSSGSRWVLTTSIVLLVVVLLEAVR